jgi:hypothetical protein
MDMQQAVNGGLNAWLDSNPMDREIFRQMSREQQVFVGLVWHAGARDALDIAIRDLRVSNWAALQDSGDL